MMYESTGNSFRRLVVYWKKNEDETKTTIVRSKSLLKYINWLWYVYHVIARVCFFGFYLFVKSNTGGWCTCVAVSDLADVFFLLVIVFQSKPNRLFISRMQWVSCCVRSFGVVLTESGDWFWSIARKMPLHSAIILSSFTELYFIFVCIQTRADQSA